MCTARSRSWRTERTVQQVLVLLGETLCRDGIVVERAPPIRPISNITPSMVAAKCHHYFFCAFCVTCARHETKSLFRFRFRFLAFPLRPFSELYRVSTGIGYQIQFLFFSPVILMSCCRFGSQKNA